MSEHLLLPQPPLTPAQISLGKDVEIRRLNDVLAALTMHWSTEKPKQPGWYWYRDKVEGACAIYIDEVCGELETMHDQFDHKVSDLTGEWSGPLPVPLEAPQ